MARIDFQMNFTATKAGLNEISSILKQIQTEASKASLSGTLTNDLRQAANEARKSENILNNNAMVARLEYKNFKMLFTGDIEIKAEQEILKIYKDTNYLKADILKVAHHRSQKFINTRIFRQSKTKNSTYRSRNKQYIWTSKSTNSRKNRKI